MRRWVCLLWICLTFHQVYISHILHVMKNSCFCTTHKSSVSTGFAEQIMPILHTLRYNGSLVTWTVVSLTTAKFKPLIFSMPDFTLSYTTNMFILMIPYDFYLFPAQLCYIILYVYIYIWNVKSWVEIADRCAPWKFPMVRRTLFCRRCNFKRQVSATNSQVGQVYIITDLISALCKVSSMLALKCSLFNRN
jgi:hypothetical protein